MDPRPLDEVNDDEELTPIDAAEFPEGDTFNSTDFNPDGTAKEG